MSGEVPYFRLPFGTFPTEKGPVTYLRGDEPEAVAREEKRRRQRRQAEADAAAVFDPVHTRADAGLRKVLDLHRPSVGSGGLGFTQAPRCYGCDQGPHPEDYPSWPCTTFETIRDHLNQETT